MTRCIYIFECKGWSYVTTNIALGHWYFANFAVVGYLVKYYMILNVYQGCINDRGYTTVHVKSLNEYQSNFFDYSTIGKFSVSLLIGFVCQVREGALLTSTGK